MKEITLLGGLIARIDDEDFELVSNYQWRCANRKKPWKYAISRVSGILMHRLITNATKGVLVDHKNGDGLDNRRENLRLATHAENMRNSKGHKNTKSGIKGAYWHDLAKKWFSSIMVNRVNHRLGFFDTPEEAGLAYAEAAKRLHGEFHNLGS